jgi:alpha-mannosidase
VRREVRLWRDCRRIDFAVEIEAEPACGVFFLRFPLAIQGRVFAGIPFGAEPRENFDAEPFRGEYFALGHPDAYYATRWTDVSSEDFGATFIAPHGMHNGYEYRRKERVLEFALLRVRPMPEGGWNQVHPSIQGTGRHRWTCSLVPHAKTWRDAATYRDALERHSPLAAYSPAGGPGRVSLAASPPPGEPGSVADCESFVEVTPANVVLSALRCLEPSGDSGGAVWELRLYETTGQTSEATIRLRDPVREIQVTNLLGRPESHLAPPRISGREVHVQIPPWKIVTLRAVTGSR